MSKKNEFYKEPARQERKELSPCQRYIGNHNWTPDELEYEKKQNSEMEDEEELPF